MRSGSRAVLCALLASMAALPGCGHDPFDDVAITAVELRQAPKLEFLRARVGMKFREVRFEVENRSREPLTLARWTLFPNAFWQS